MYGEEVQPVYPAFSFVTESMADLKPNLDTLEQTTFLKIITGELPVDAFDQFVTDWYAQGGQMMTDEVNEIIM
jgi:putative aldouronate transport system substrate-binding protein